MESRMTKIEAACFTSSMAHWVSSISYRAADFLVVLHPANDVQSEVQVVFRDVSMMRIDTSYNDGDLSFPWDIIGFESRHLENEKWEFVLHTDMVEFSFQARWPNIDTNEKNTAGHHGIRQTDPYR